MNKNLIVTLVVGLAVGFFFGRWSAPVAPPAVEVVGPHQTPAVASRELVVQAKPIAENTQKKSAPVKFELVQGPVVQVPDQASEQNFEMPSDEMDASVDRRQLYMDQRMIERMERDWQDLPGQIRVTREPRGWRVQQMSPGSLFAQAGFLKNDLITREAVESLSYQTEDGDLPARFSAILSHVQIR